VAADDGDVNILQVRSSWLQQQGVGDAVPGTASTSLSFLGSNVPADAKTSATMGTVELTGVGDDVDKGDGGGTATALRPATIPANCVKGVSRGLK
jgi:hypothetical protein